MVVVQVDKVTKKYDDLHAVNDVSLKVNQGEAVAIIGSSGSGKSTLLRCINCLERVDKGSIFIDGETIVQQSDLGTQYVNDREIRRICTKTGMVFQHFNLFPHLSCLDNITIAPIKILKQDRKKAEENAKQLLLEVGLGEKADSYPSQLSGGQQQRVAIARALAMAPKIMLFDEPTSALDPEIIGEVTNVIYNLVKRKTTMIIVTHDMQFARNASSRVIYLDKGCVLEEGTPEALFSNPQSLRLKEFISNVG